MVKKALVIIVVILLSSINIYAEELKYAEIFSINQEKVVKVVQSNSEIQSLAENYLEGIEGIYGKFDPIPSSGYAVKIPLNHSVKVQRNGFNTVVDQVIIMFPEGEAPFLIIFENEGKLVCFTFKGDTDILWNKLEYNPSASQ